MLAVCIHLDIFTFYWVVLAVFGFRLHLDHLLLLCCSSCQVGMVSHASECMCVSALISSGGSGVQHRCPRFHFVAFIVFGLGFGSKRVLLFSCLFGILWVMGKRNMGSRQTFMKRVTGV
ncbi:hypothetical protein BJY04DRAFT_14415 [Aspergillus karnatakaensis]|uniref:uncharacterized protein n=1 Tax=Aspergillus karnatakaensis TaxID=1810916 RepID=UPI003CCE2E0B